MTLQPDPAKQGLWSDPAWQPGTAGTFVVVIGISAYDHLEGGRDPAPDAYELGQLQVSALTAYRFFDWLRSAYRYEECAIARCWLLLAPTQAELDAEPALGDHAAQPTFGACKTAIQEWYAAMKDLPPDAARESRAFFFFSGHGLEAQIDEQILLASDYLGGPLPNPSDNAINTRSLWLGLSPLEVPCQFLFADACRNDHLRLLDLSIKGAEVLPISRNVRSRQRIAPILYASASGSQAWQPLQPSPGLEGTSLFGRALLEGLHAQEGFEPDCSADPCAINMFPLHTFVRRRVARLLATNESSEQQPVVLGGGVSDVVVTQVPRPSAAVAASPLPPTVAETEAQVFKIRHELPELRPSPDGSRFLRPPGSAATPQPTSLVDPHPVFGSETVTEQWGGARVYRVRGAELLAPGSDYLLHRVERHESRNAYRVELSIQDSDGPHWLELTDHPPGAAPVVFACLLPGDQAVRPRYVLTLTREPAGQGHRLIRLDAALSRDNPDVLGHAAELWETYRTANIDEAASTMDLRFLEEALRGKARSPLAATVAATLLLRAGRLELLHDWVRTLADGFPELADGPILWMEQRLQEGDADRPAEDDLGRWLELEARGVPTTNEGFGYAALQARDFLELEGLSDEQRRRVQAVDAHLSEAQRYFRSGGLFSTFTGLRGEFGPHLVGPWSRQVARP